MLKSLLPHPPLSVLCVCVWERERQRETRINFGGVAQAKIRLSHFSSPKSSANSIWTYKPLQRRTWKYKDEPKKEHSVIPIFHYDNFVDIDAPTFTVVSMCAPLSDWKSGLEIDIGMTKRYMAGDWWWECVCVCVVSVGMYRICKYDSFLFSYGTIDDGIDR